MEVSNYQRKLIYKAIGEQIKKAKAVEIDKLAKGMKITNAEIVQIYKEEKEKSADE